MRPLRSWLALLASGGGLLTSCELPEPDARAAPAAAAEAPEVVRSPEPPARLREWPVLERWYAGEEAPREPATSPISQAERAASGTRAEADSRSEAQASWQGEARGAALFSLYCVNCHGPSGRGDGPRAPLFEPPPRDLARGVFKFRSTPSGSLPAEVDLFRTISGGVLGTGMPSFADLPESDRWALVSHVRSLSPRFTEEPRPETIAIPSVPSDLDLRAARGRKTWTRLECAACHGADGRGDGPSAATLTDISGARVFVPDFAVQPFKRGDDPSAMYLTILAGLDGTPMPAYRGQIEDGDVWDLVAYARSLGSRVEVPAEYREAMGAFFAAQAAQSRHATIGGCGCQAMKLASRLEAARAHVRAVRSKALRE